jgi:valyl-tRNA synthetase
VVTLHVYDAILRLLHPFMPFITEELWQRLGQHAQAAGRPASISITSYPQPLATSSTQAEAQFGLLQRIVTAARELRADNKLDPKVVYDATLHCHGTALAASEMPVLETLTKLRIQSGTSSSTGLLRSTPEFDLRLEPMEASNGAGAPESRARIEKEITNLEKVIESSNRQLSDESFLGKAPAKVVETVRAKLADYQAQLAKNKKLLEGLD